MKEIDQKGLSSGERREGEQPSNVEGAHNEGIDGVRLPTGDYEGNLQAGQYSDRLRQQAMRSVLTSLLKRTEFAGGHGHFRDAVVYSISRAELRMEVAMREVIEGIKMRLSGSDPQPNGWTTHLDLLLQGHSNEAIAEIMGVGMVRVQFKNDAVASQARRFLEFPHESLLRPP